jgi:hypothetical protein
LKRFVPPLLVLALGLVAASTPALAQATPPYKCTIVVGGGANPKENGTQLLNAMIQIGETGPDNRWLVRLEPGVSAELRDLSVQNISTANSEGILLESSNARVTRVNVQARGAMGAHSIRIYRPSEAITPVLTDLELTASNASPSHYATGVFIVTANPVIRNVSVTINDSPNNEKASGGVDFLSLVRGGVGRPWRTEREAWNSFTQALPLP